ncbi:MAG: hypothetical protein E6R03_09615 [Hyphomicrobiaceae bacterium]|nr:MAG: hypothetical protein E6R03_09615 [Hyphomicrobiaceae bacterium]
MDEHPDPNVTILGMTLAGTDPASILRFIRKTHPVISLRAAHMMRLDARLQAIEAAKALLCAENEGIRWLNAYGTHASLHGPTPEHTIPQGKSASEIQFGPDGVWGDYAAKHGLPFERVVAAPGTAEDVSGFVR